LLRWSITSDTIFFVFFFSAYSSFRFHHRLFRLFLSFLFLNGKRLIVRKLFSHMLLLTYWITICAWIRWCTLSRVWDNAQRPEGRQLCQYLKRRKRKWGSEGEKEKKVTARLYDRRKRNTRRDITSSALGELYVGFYNGLYNLPSWIRTLFHTIYQKIAVSHFLIRSTWISRLFWAEDTFSVVQLSMYYRWFQEKSSSLSTLSVSRSSESSRNNRRDRNNVRQRQYAVNAFSW